MLAKRYRLPIQLVFRKKGTPRRSKFLYLRVFAPEERYSRLGIVISKKVLPLPSKRNRLKRIIFSFFESQRDKIIPKDFLLILEPGAAGLTEDEIKEELKKLFQLGT